jgi:hypothetical protein
MAQGQSASDVLRVSLVLTQNCVRGQLLLDKTAQACRGSTPLSLDHLAHVTQRHP